MAIDYNNFKIIKNRKGLKRLIKYCKQTGYASIDFETSGHEWHSPLGYPTILGVSFQPGSGWIIPLGHFDSPFKDEWEEILGIFSKEVIENPDIIKIAHNIKFEMKWFTKYGYKMKGLLFDNMLAKYLLDEEKPMGLKPLVDKLLPQYFGYSEDYEGSKLPWDQKPLIPLSQYCALDCDNTFRLFIFLESQLIKHGLYPLFRNMYMMGARVLDESEYAGFPIDEPLLSELEIKYGILIEEKEKELRKNKYIKKFEISLIKDRVDKYIEKIEEEIYELKKERKKLKREYKLTRDNKLQTASNRKKKSIESRLEKIDRLMAGDFSGAKNLQKLSEPVNFNSPDQMRDLLYFSEAGFRFKPFRFTIDKNTKKETDKPSTDEFTLTELAKKDKTGFMNSLLDFRGLTKMHSAFIVGVRERLTVDNKIHSRYLLEGTVTSRLSSSDINMQQIPRVTSNPDIKRMFIPPKGHLLLQLDYSQAELRVMAAMANETNMLRWFREGRDIHLAVALQKHHCEERYDEIKALLKSEDGSDDFIFWTKERKKAKTINFGVIYGQGAPKLSESLECSKEEAQQFLDDYFRQFPKIKKFIAKQHRLAHKQGYVRNLFGFKRRLPNIDSRETYKVAEAERQAVNCLEPSVQVLSKKGWAYYSELKEGDEILTKNRNTLELEWQPILKMNIFNYEGDAYRFKNGDSRGNYSINVLSTPNHRWFVKRTTRHSRVKQENMKTRKLPIDEILTSEQLSNTSKVKSIHLNGKYNPKRDNTYLDAFISLLGWILTDGSIRYKGDKVKYATLTQSFIANPHKCEIIDNIITQLGWDVRKRERGRAFNWRFNKKQANIIAAAIPNKELGMELLLKLDSKQLNLLLEAIQLGDGIKITTARKTHRDAFQALIVMCGKSSNVNVRDKIGVKHYSDKLSYSQKYIEKKQKSYHICIHKRDYIHHSNTRGKNYFSKEAYKGIMWCPTVGNGLIVARKVEENGRTQQFITGQSPIQGAASQYALFTSILVYEMRHKGILPIELPQAYTVHDSLGYFVRPEVIHDVVPVLKKLAANPETQEWFGFQIDSVEMEVDFEVSEKSWGDLRSYNPDTDYVKLVKEYQKQAT